MTDRSAKIVKPRRGEHQDFFAVWTPDWIYTEDVERDTFGYVADMLVRVDGKDKRIVSFPMLPKVHADDSDAHRYLIGRALVAIGNELIFGIEDSKVQGWDDD